MAEPFDPGPIAALLDQAAELYHAARGTHYDYELDAVVPVRTDHAEIFDARIAQAKALLDETAHHINNVLLQPVSVGGLIPDVVHKANLAAAASSLPAPATSFVTVNENQEAN